MPGTVTIGCKYPNGLVLQLYGMEDHDEPLLGGGYRTVQRAVPMGAPVTLKGWSRYITEDAPHTIMHGAGITFGVDADWFAEWLKQNAETDIVKQGLVFAHAKPAEIEAQAKDHRALKSGFERIDPDIPPAEFRGKVETHKAA